jgi:hypothetical protein
MQFKSVMVISAVFGVTALTANCSSNKGTADGGEDVHVTSPDAAADHKVPTGDSGDAAANTCGAVVACETCDVSSYTPQAQNPPIGPKSGMCPSADISAFETACLASSASSTTCDAWQTSENTSNATCLGCVYTQQTDAKWGFLVCTSSSCAVNFPGCVDMALGQVSLENSTSTGSCGDLLSAGYGCQDVACNGCTEANDPTNYEADFTACDNHAVTQQCVSYSNALDAAAVCADLAADATPPAALANCGLGASSLTDQQWDTLVGYFCGDTDGG